MARVTGVEPLFFPSSPLDAPSLSSSSSSSLASCSRQRVRLEQDGAALSVPGPAQLCPALTSSTPGRECSCSSSSSELSESLKFSRLWSFSCRNL